MAKFKLLIDETRSFRHVIEVETDLNENQLDGLLTERVDNDKTLNCLDDIRYELISGGLKVTKVVLDDDGDLGEIKIEEMEEIE